MSNVRVSSSGGTGFFGVLTILFIALKLLDKIDWSWWWVLSPIWIPSALGLAVIIICLLIWFIVWAVDR